MRDERKTKAQLIKELAELRQRVAALGASEAERVQGETRSTLDKTQEDAAQSQRGAAQSQRDAAQSQRGAALDALQRRNQELALLSRVNTFIAEAMDMADALQKVCAELADFLHVSQAGFAILNPERTSARVIADLHPPDSPSAMGVVIPVADNPGMEFVLKHKTALAVADAQTDPILAPVHQIMRQRNVRSILIVPILVEGEAMGTLGFDSFQYQEFSQADIALVQNVAGQVGQALVRKRAEEALRLTQFSVDRAGDAVYWMGPDARFFYVNEAACRSLGFSREELLSMTVHDIDPNFPEEVWPDHWREVKQRGSFTFESHNRAKDGRVFPVEITVNYLEFGGQEYNCAFARDVSERGWAESQREAALEALRESERRLSSFMNSASDSFYLLDSDLNFVEINDRGLEIIGKSREEVIGKNITDIVPDVKESGRYEKHLEVMRTGQAFVIDHFVPHPVFGDLHFVLKSFKVGDGLGIITSDITERVRAEEALRQRAEELATLQATVLDITAPHDLPTLLQTIVERAARLLDAPGGGLYLNDPDREEVRCVLSYNTPRDYTGTTLKYGEGAAGTVAQTGEPLIIDDYRAWRGRAAVYEEEQPFTSVLSAPMIWRGQVTGVIHVLHDVESRRFTQADLELLSLFANHAAIAVENARLYEEAQKEIAERGRAEAEIRKLGQFLDSVIESANVWLNVLDEKGNVALWNRAAEEISGYSREEVLGHDKIWKWLYREEEYRNQVFAAAIAVIEEGGGEEGGETKIQCKDGRKRIISWNSQRLVDEKGNSMGSVALGRDITERKRAESQREAALEALRESEAKYRELVENANSIIFRMDTQGRVTFFNEFAQSFFGYTEDEILGRNVVGAFVPERDSSGQDLAGMIHAILEHPEKYANNENENMRRNGERVWVAWTNKAIRDENGRLTEVLCVGNDITERRRAESQREAALEALRENEARLQSIFRAAPVGIGLASNRVLLHVNDRMCEMLGYSSDELIGKSARVLYPTDADYEYAGAEKYAQIRELGTGTVETRWQRKDGRILDVLMSSTPLNPADLSVGVTFTGLDITERVQAESQREAALEELRESNQRLEDTLAELKATQKQIVQQERLAAVGQLAAGVAHDFNNLLTGIIGFAELVLMDPDVPARVQPELGRIVKQGRQAGHLVQQILDFSRKSIRQPQPLKLVPFLKEAVRFLERTIPETIHIRLEIEAIEPMIQADPTQIQQVVTNLAVNARDAMPGGGELKLRLSSLTLAPDEESPGPDMWPGEWVVLSVSDTGTGIPDEVLPHIFEPFFTTRAPQGSGLGLAQVYGIVKQHEGHIEVESQVGEGTTFTIYLPALEKREEAPRRQAREEIPRGQGQTVLLVEDEPMVLEVGQAMLERLGYRVLTAVDGEQALEVFREHQEEIKLVLADVVMPEMGGVALLHVLKGQNPDVKMVLTTGYPLGEEAQELLDQGIVDWLQKPVSLAQLAQVVSRALL